MGAVSDVQTYLEAQDIIGGSTGWTSVRRRMHEAADKMVVLTEDGGAAPEIQAATGLGDAALKDPGVQIMVRAEEWDGDAALAKAQAIFDALHGLSGTVGSGSYLRIKAMTSEPLFAGYDDRGRPIHTIAFRLMSLV